MGFVIKPVYQRCLSMEIEAFSLQSKMPLVGLLFVILSLFCSQNASLLAVTSAEAAARAYHGDLSGTERVEAYYEVLRLINRGQLTIDQVQEFMTNLKGFLKHRSTKNAAVLRALNNLVSGILMSRASELAPFAKDMNAWKDALDADLRHFALTNGSVVKVTFSKVPAKNLAVRASGDQASLDLLDDAGLSSFFKLAVRGARADSVTQQIVSGGTDFDLIPLYVDQSGVGCGFEDSCCVQIGGDVLTVVPVVTLKALEASEPLRLMKRESIPAYTGEENFVAHQGCGQWATVIESVSEDVLAKLENDNFSQALNRIKMMSKPSEKLRWLYALRNNINERVNEKNTTMLFKQLSAVFGLRNKFNKQELIEARRLLLAYKQKNVLKEYDKHFTEWLRDLVLALESYAVRFRDAVTIKSANVGAKLLCVAPYVAPAAGGFAQEMRIGIGDGASVSKKHALISLVSAVGKLGAVKYGDEVELSVCYAHGSELRCVVEQRGESFGGRVIAVPVEDTDVDSDSIFIVEHTLGSLLKDNSPLVAGDSFMLRSKKTSQILATSSELLGLWQAIWAKSDLQIKKEQALSAFSVEVETEDVVQQVVEQSFYEQLAKVRKNPTPGGKITDLLSLMDTLNPRISSQERTDLWDVLSSVVSDKKYMQEHELQRLEELLQKVVVIAKSNNIPLLGSKAQLALNDLGFHKKMTSALAEPGMDRFKALLELAPSVKGVSLQQSQAFLDELALLRKYKKDQSRAAKLLLQHASDEFGQDFKTTGSGNLLVR